MNNLILMNLVILVFFIDFMILLNLAILLVSVILMNLIILDSGESGEFGESVGPGVDFESTLHSGPLQTISISSSLPQIGAKML